MNLYFALTGFFNALFSFLPGLYVYLKNRTNALNRSFFFFSITVSLWSTFYGIWQLQTTKPEALFYMRLAMVPCYHIPFAFLYFALTLIEHPKRKFFLPFCILIPTFFSLISFTDLAVKDVVRRLYFQFWPTPGFLMHIYVLLFFSTLVYAFSLLFIALAKSSGLRRWQIKWVSFTLLFAWLAGSTNWFLWYDIPVPPTANIFVAVVFLILAYALIRRRLFDVDVLAEVIQEAKLSAIGLLAAGIHHEIRSPLYVVKSLVESYLADQKDGVYDELSFEEREKKMQEIMERTLGQVERTVEIMRRFSEFAKPRTGPRLSEAVFLKQVVEYVVPFIRFETQTRKIVLKTNIEDHISIQADRKEVEEVLLNLVLNACQAMPGGGELTISASRHCEAASQIGPKQSQTQRLLRPRHEILAGPRNDDVVQITIQDTGIGISPEQANHLFEPFFTTKGEKGVGLGLYVTKQLVERNGGKISVKSDPGHGATFVLEFKVT